MYSPRRQHPILILFNVIKLLRELIIPIILAFVTSLSKFSTERMLLSLAIGGVLLLILFLGAFFSWYRHTYHIYGDELRIQSGILIKNKRFIPRERIQTMNITAGVLQRIFGVVKVEIETAGGRGKAEATLAAVSNDDAETLRKHLIEQQKINEPEQEQAASVKYVLAPKALLIAAATSGSIGIVLSFVSAVLAQIDALIPGFNFWHWLGQHIELNFIFLLGLILAIALFSWLISILGTVIKYANFTLVRTEDKIHISRGLFERQEFTVPLKRIQAVQIVEGVLRQPFGLAALNIVSAGRGEKGALTTVLFPLLKKRRVNALLQELAPDFASNITLHKIPARALPRYIIKTVFLTLLITIPAALFTPVGYLALLPVPVAFGYGMLRYKDAGWANPDSLLLLRERKIARTTTIIPSIRMQSAKVSQSFMQKRKNLASFTVAVISLIGGTRFRIIDIEGDTAISLLNWFASKLKKSKAE